MGFIMWKVTAYKDGLEREFCVPDFKKYAEPAGWRLEKCVNYEVDQVEEDTFEAEQEGLEHHVDDDGLDKLSESELRGICKDLGFNPGGRSSVETIIKRIREHREG